ncbi:MAG: hypothetical protein IIB65_11425 [Proteobacteria bacterium]|nr:hypothetical protein [Pseudomonadota bacterium]
MAERLVETAVELQKISVERDEVIAVRAGTVIVGMNFHRRELPVTDPIDSLFGEDTVDAGPEFLGDGVRFVTRFPRGDEFQRRRTGRSGESRDMRRERTRASR